MCKNSILNFAYVYTNIDDIEIKEDIGRGYVVIHASKRIAKYKPVALPSVHRKRHREQTRLNPLFTRLFFEEAQIYKLGEKVKTRGQHIQPAFISDWKAENIHTIAGGHIRADVKIEKASDMDLQRLFDYFVRKNLTPFSPRRPVCRATKGMNLSVFWQGKENDNSGIFSGYNKYCFE